MWLGTLRVWIRLSQQRRHLSELTDLNEYLLKHIGVSEDEALRAKSFWS